MMVVLAHLGLVFMGAAVVVAQVLLEQTVLVLLAVMAAMAWRPQSTVAVLPEQAAVQAGHFREHLLWVLRVRVGVVLPRHFLALQTLAAVVLVPRKIQTEAQVALV
jgi:hypothetical protein